MCALRLNCNARISNNHTQSRYWPRNTCRYKSLTKCRYYSGLLLAAAPSRWNFGFVDLSFLSLTQNTYWFIACCIAFHLQILLPDDEGRQVVSF
jgi:hypothetical protein